MNVLCIMDYIMPCQGYKQEAAQKSTPRLCQSKQENTITKQKKTQIARDD